MAKENKKNNDMAEEKEQQADSKNGNFFSRYGKIFLIVAVLLAQAGAAYAIVNSYYEEIYQLVDSLSTEGKIYHTYENIIINPANSDGERYLILSIAVEVNSSGDAARLKSQKAQIIDRVNLILTKRTASELSQLETREEIKQEIGLTINDILDKNAVRNLFFTKYVLQ